MKLVVIQCSNDNEKEWAFYITVGVVVVENELALRFGGHLIVFPLSLLLALAVGYWAFPSKKK